MTWIVVFASMRLLKTEESVFCPMIYNRINIRNFSYDAFWGLYVEKYDRIGNMYDDIEKYIESQAFKTTVDDKVEQLNNYLPPLNWLIWVFNIKGMARAWCIQKMAHYTERPAVGLEKRWDPLIDRAVRISRFFFTSAFVSSSGPECMEAYPDFGWFRSNQSAQNPDIGQRLSDGYRITEIRGRQCKEKKDIVSKRRENYDENDRKDLKTVGIDFSGNDFSQITYDAVNKAIKSQYLKTHPDKGGDPANFDLVHSAANRLFENERDRQLLEWCEEQIQKSDSIYRPSVR